MENREREGAWDDGALPAGEPAAKSLARPRIGSFPTAAHQKRQGGCLGLRDARRSGDGTGIYDNPAPVTDYASYSAARRALGDELARYDLERLKRDRKITRLESEHKQARDALVALQIRAQHAARGARGTTQRTPRFDRARVEQAISTVNRRPGYNEGFLKKLEIKADAREAASYLQSILHHFDPDVQRLDATDEAKRNEIVEAGAAAEAAVKNAAATVQGEVQAFVQAIGASAQPFDHESWTETDWDDGEGIIRLADAYHWIGDQKYVVPYLARIPGHNFFASQNHFAESRKDLVNGLLLRAVRALPPGRVRLLLVDPTSLGNVFAPLLSLGEHSEAIISTKVWTTEADIRQRLEEESERVGLIIQKYLTDEYETLDEYNRAAGEVAEESVVIAINDFPLGLDQRSIEIVKSLSEVGPRCGVSLVVLQAQSIPNELWSVCNAIAKTGHKASHWTVADSFRNWNSYAGRYDHYRPGLDDSLLEKVGSFLDLFHFEEGALTWRPDAYSWVGGDGSAWHAEPPAKWRPELAEGVLESASRRFAEGARVEVRLEQVWQLFAENQRRTAPVKISDANSLWRESSLDQLVVPVGRHGSRGVSTFKFDSQLQSSALLVGRPGSGKSNLLHVIICTLASMYSPEELELYLLDFKEAVEFAGYASGALPHAKAIALESDREFGLAVLRHLGEEIERRGRLFRDGGGEQTNIVTYRSNGGRKLARILLLVDEFHRLFDREDALSNEAAKYLDDIVRLGRGFGIHCLLASQTLLGMSGLGRHTLNQIAIRAALQCSDEDSRIVFSEDNPAAALLTRPGEAVKNTSGGRLANNEPFQVPLLAESDRRQLIGALELHARHTGHRALTRVYRRDVQARWEKPKPAASGEPVSLRFGDAVAIDPVMRYELTREGGKNVLVVGRNEILAGEMVAASLTDVRVRHGDSVEVTVIDLMAVDGPVAVAAEATKATIVRRRDYPRTIIDVARTVEATEPTRNQSTPTRVIVLNGLGKARDLDPEDYTDEGQALVSAMATVVRDGPELGIHTIVWADSVATIDRRLGRLEREFGARVVFRVGSDDSMRLCDADLASGLREREAVLVDVDRGTSVKFQPFAAPDFNAELDQADEVESLA
jgi:S-DNA-T family DNA segregation ATPase FtsK/SpoIIIE